MTPTYIYTSTALTYPTLTHPALAIAIAVARCSGHSLDLINQRQAGILSPLHIEFRYGNQKKLY